MTKRLLVVASPGTEATILDVFERLLDEGAELVFGYGKREGKLPAAFLDRDRVSVAHLPLERSGPGSKSVKLFRHGANTLRFMDPQLEGGSWARLRAGRWLFKLMRHPDHRHAADVAAGTELPERMYRRLAVAARDIERLLPPHPELEDATRELAPDALVVVSRLGLNSLDLDMLKAARRLGVPSALLVWSWDNLSSKAVLTEHPDRVLVWNELQAEEAESFHGIDRARVDVVGAPNFDRYFDAVASSSQGNGETTLLYLGSSPNVCEHEAPVCERWIAAVRASGDELLAGARIVVRPHPANHSFDEWTAPDDRVELVRARKLEPTALAKLVLEAAAIVALNTSAELEAAIAERPVLTFRAGDEAPGQEGSIHFAYLLEANDGFVLDARDLDEHVASLARVVRGDYDRERIRRFVERFVRPRGIDRPVAPIVADAILELTR